MKNARDAVAAIEGVLGDKTYVTARESGIEIQFRVNVDERLTEMCKLPADVRSSVTSLFFVETTTPACLRACKCFTKVTSIYVSSLNDGPAALSDLVMQCKNLESLWCSDSKLTTDELKLLGTHTNLKILMMGGNRIETGQFEALRELKKIRQLDLSRMDVRDGDIKCIKHMQQLTFLSLSETKISDAGISELAKLRSLEILILTRTTVTKEGVEELRKAIPKCIVTWGNM